MPLLILMSSDKELSCGHKPVAKESQRQTALEADKIDFSTLRSHIPLAAISLSTVSVFVE